MKQEIRAITLIELLISIVLLSVIVLGLNSIDFFSRFQVVNSERRVKLQNEASVVLEHMAKHIAQAVGNKSQPPVVSSSIGIIYVRIDTNENGQVDNADTLILYRLEDTKIYYYKDLIEMDPPPDPGLGTGEVIATNIVTAADTNPGPGLVFTFPRDADNNIIVNQCNITVRARWLPEATNLPSSQDNPQVELQNSVVMPSVSTN